MACCTNCEYGCDGGTPLLAIQYIANSGLVTGGLDGDKTSCQPYTPKPCEHHVPGDRPLVIIILLNM